MTHELRLASAVTGPSDAARLAHHRGTRRQWGMPARRPRHRSPDPSVPHRPALDTGMLPGHRTAYVVVEIEPSDAAVSDLVPTRLAAGSALIGVASDDATVGHLRRTRPWLTVLQGDATDLRQVLNTAGITQVHLVISTLSPALMTEATQRRVIADVARVLHPDGCFAVVVAPPPHSQLTVRRLRLRLRLSEVFTVVTGTAAVGDHGAPGYLLVARKPTRPPVGMRRGERFLSAHTDLSAAA